MVASFGNRRSMWCLNGGGIVELSCCPFFKPGGTDSLRFVFRMNRATCGGRIWDSTHLLSSSMSSPSLLSFMLSADA